MRLSAFDALGRGIAHLRAHWALVPWLMTASFLLTQLVAASVVLPVRALGLDFDVKAHLLEAPEAALAWLGDLSSRLEVTPVLLAALAGSLGLLTLAGFVYCFAQAGLYGVLAAADGAGRDRSPETARAIGRSSAAQASDFAGAGGASFWRYFWLLNLYSLYAGLVVMLALGGVGLVAWAAARWGALSALGMGCGVLIPVVLGGLACWAWYAVARAELSRPRSSVRGAARRGVEILRRRLGAVLLLLVLFGVASMTIQLAFAPFSALSAWFLGDRPFLARATEIFLDVAASLPAAIADVVLAGSLIALNRAEGAPA